MERIGVKRIYEEASEADGYRILVDRLWPRGVSKKDANLDEWNKDIAPSNELRKWFDHKAHRFEEFTHLYHEELKAKEEELNRLRVIAKSSAISLLYSAKDPTINQAVILRDVLYDCLNKK